MSTDSHSSERPFIVVSGDFVRTGGQDVANFSVVDYLSRAGREVHAVGYRFDPDLRKNRNAHLHTVPKLARSDLLSAPLLSTSALAQYFGRFKSKPHVLANGGNCPTPSANWVHYVHAAYHPQSASLRRRAMQTYSHPMSQLTERVALHAARVIIANSNRTKADLIELVGIRESRIETVYYGTDNTRFVPVTPSERQNAIEELGWSPHKFRFVFVGALGDRRKGFDVLFEAWKVLRLSKAWECELVVVGRGAELGDWRRRVEAAKLEDSIKFLGFRSDVPRILAASNVLVAPTRYEAYGLAVHEALCTGLPAVVSARAGVAERYPRELENLLIRDPSSASELAERLQYVRDYSNQLRPSVVELGNLLRAWTWDDMARTIERACDSGLG